jgi:hypothetical protein
MFLKLSMIKEGATEKVPQLLMVFKLIELHVLDTSAGKQLS